MSIKYLAILWLNLALFSFKMLRKYLRKYLKKYSKKITKNIGQICAYFSQKYLGKTLSEFPTKFQSIENSN